MEQTGNVVWPEEIEILKQLDQTYRSAVANEIKDIRRRQASENN